EIEPARNQRPAVRLRRFEHHRRTGLGAGAEGNRRSDQGVGYRSEGEVAVRAPFLARRASERSGSSKINERDGLAKAMTAFIVGRSRNVSSRWRVGLTKAMTA